MLEKRIVDVGDGKQYIEVKGVEMTGELSEVKLPNDKLMLVGIGPDGKIHPAYVYYPMFGPSAWTLQEVNANDASFQEAIEKCPACQTAGDAWMAMDKKTTTPLGTTQSVQTPPASTPQLPAVAAAPSDQAVPSLSIGKIPLPYVVAGLEILQGLTCKKKSGKFFSTLLISGLFDYLSNWPEDVGMQRNLHDLSSMFASRLKIKEEDMPEFEQEMGEMYKTYQQTNDLLEGVRKGMFGRPAASAANPGTGPGGRIKLSLTVPLNNSMHRTF